MDLSVLKNKVASLPRNRRGRVIMSVDVKAEICAAIKECGYKLTEVAQAVGLPVTTLHGYVQPSRSRGGRVKFNSVKVVDSRAVSWEVLGPKGLRIQCQSLTEVELLWSALCS